MANQSGCSEKTSNVLVTVHILCPALDLGSSAIILRLLTLVKVVLRKSDRVVKPQYQLNLTCVPAQQPTPVLPRRQRRPKHVDCQKHRLAEQVRKRNVDNELGTLMKADS